jgi:hypothetical protein
MKGYAITRKGGRDFAYWQARLRDEIPHADPEQRRS